jgi:ribonuclease T2
MKNKTLIRLVIAAIVAVIGAWQMQGTNPQKSPSQTTQKQPGSASNKASTPGDFDYYLVSLSWSPAYCINHPKDQRQCGGRGFGFILHGLWPQHASGGYPQDCPSTSRPSSSAIQKTLAFMPSEKLIQHEWAKHGTCTGLSADEYLALADKAFSLVQIPAGFQAPSTPRTLTAEQIRNEFTKANPSFPENSIVLKCSGTELEEVRVCANTQLKPQSCGKGIRTQCKGDAIQIRPLR